MKKIIAAAVATAFVAPAFAADITISGDQEFSYTDANGATSTAIDGDFNIKASTSTANGISVSADINISDEGEDDGSNSLTLSGDFGKFDLGDTSSAADSVDDRTDYSYVTGVATTAGDAAIGWSLPSMVPNLSVYVSHGTDTDEDGEAHTGYALEYSAGPVEVAYAVNNNDDATKITYVGATASFGGAAVSIERMDDDADDTEEAAMGISYGMGDMTIYLANEETQEANVTTADVTAFGLSYSLGGGVTAFIESSSDDNDAANDETTAGVTFAF
jgi:hypothetical protein